MSPSGTQSDVKKFREFIAQPGWSEHYGDLPNVPDGELQVIIDGAKAWIAGRRWSWTIVTANYLRDGRYHG